MKISCVIVAVASALLFLLTVACLPTCQMSASWIGSISYFAFTFLALQRYDDGSNTTALVWSTVLGRLLVELPIVILYYVNRIEALLVTCVTLSAIVLAATYWRNRTGAVLMLSVIILILLNTLGYDAWVELTAHPRVA